LLLVGGGGGSVGNVFGKRTGAPCRRRVVVTVGMQRAPYNNRTPSRRPARPA